MFSLHRFIILVLAVSITLTVISDKGTAAMVTVPCKRCESMDECDDAPPTVCIYGEDRNYCKRRVCSKGPGEKCGDRFNVLGTCGEGLWCSSKDNRCHGCYIPTMACYPED